MVGLPDLGGLLDPGFRQPASCVIEMGTARTNIGPIAALVAEVEIQTAREEAATGRIVIEDRRREDGTWTAADSGLFTRWAPIRVSADFETHRELILSGYVLRLAPDYPGNAAEAKLTIEVQDEGAALSREQMRRVWGEEAPITDLAILGELVRDADIRPDAASAQGQSSRQLSQDATPIQFLRERARANGYELIFLDGRVYFGPRRLTGTPQAPILVYAGRTTNARSFALQDMADTPDAVRVDLAPREEGATPEVTTVTPAEPVLGTTPAAAEGAALGTARGTRPPRRLPPAPRRSLTCTHSSCAPPANSTDRSTATSCAPARRSPSTVPARATAGCTTSTGSPTE